MPEDDSPPLAADFPVHRPIATRWSDNDHYGHVNNVVFYEFFDTAVNSWLIEASGCDIRDLPAIGVVAETSCRFLNQLSFPDQVVAGIALERRGRTSVVYRLGIFRAVDGVAEDPVCALGRFVHVYVDNDTRRPVPIPDAIGRALDQLSGSGENSGAPN